MTFLAFAWHYLVAVGLSWFGLILLVVGLVDGVTYVTGHQADAWRQRWRVPCLLLLVFCAQFEAYRELQNQAEQSGAAITAQLKQAEATVGDMRGQLEDAERRLRHQEEQIDQLRTTVARAPVPVDLRVSSTPPAGLLPSYVLSDMSIGTYWGPLPQWINPQGNFREVAVDWNDVPADTVALAELKAFVGSSDADGWAQVRVIDLNDGSVVAESNRLPGSKDTQESIKLTFPIKANTGQHRYVLQIRTSPNASINLRGDLVFVRKARWG